MKNVTKEEVVETAEVAFDDIEFKVEADGEKASMTLKDEKYFPEKLKEAGIDKKTFEAVAAFEKKYLNQVTDAAIKETGKVFKDNKDVKVVNGHLSFGYNKSEAIKLNVVKEKTYPIPNSGGKTVTKPAVNIAVETPRYYIPKAQRNRMRDALAEAIAK